MARSSPASVCLVSCTDLDRSATFYRDVLGLEASPERRLQGDAFTGQLRLPRGTGARGVLLSYPGSAVGRILLVQFDAPAGNVRGPALTRQFLGLWNLNFYTLDIDGAARELAAHGCPSWTPPAAYEIDGSTGAPTEAIVDGPDGVIFNLVQPQGPPDTLVGQVRAFLDARGTTRTGFTEVVTTCHQVDDMAAAVAFYRDGLGLEVWIDAVFAKEVTNRFLDLPLDGRTHVVFLKGDHLFGKVALSQPLNYPLPNRAPWGEAPATGYLAMGFEVDDAAAALAAVERTGATLYGEGPAVLDLPGLGERRCALVRTPGSGALSWLLERG